MNDEQLILYYYDDGLGRAERKAIAFELQRDPELARRYAELTRELDALRDAEPVAVPEGLQERLRATVHRAARLEEAGRRAPSARWHLPSFLVGGAVTAALVVGLGIGLWMGGGLSPTNPVPAQSIGPAAAEWSPDAFQRGLQAHFRSSRMDLQAFPGNGTDDRKALVAGLLEQNRAYARLAMQNGAPDLARVLRSFDSILLRLAAEDLSPAEVDELRAQLDFEFNVVLTKLARQASDERTSTKQETTI